MTARPQELAEADLEDVAQARRPEIQRLDYLARAAAASIEAAWGGHLPTLDLRADLGQSGRDTLDDEYHDYGLYLGLPIFTGWRTTGAVVERRALHRAALKALEQQRQSVRSEVRQGWQGLLEARAKVEVGAVQLMAAEENWRLVKGRYDNGLATPLELSEARTQRFSAQAAVVQAHYGVLAALAELDRAVGGGLEPFLPAAAPAAPAAPPPGGQR
ncbi:MAG: TolC family protein [Desulfarculus sp.]|nr:TolC family protein [Desulfarculus sp.]